MCNLSQCVVNNTIYPNMPWILYNLAQCVMNSTCSFLYILEWNKFLNFIPISRSCLLLEKCYTNKQNRNFRIISRLKREQNINLYTSSCLTWSLNNNSYMNLLSDATGAIWHHEICVCTNNLILENRKVSVTGAMSHMTLIPKIDASFCLRNIINYLLPTLSNTTATTTTILTNYYFQLFCFKFWLV